MHPDTRSTINEHSSEALPSAVVLHGNDNLFSIVRSLGKRGIPVHLLNNSQAVAQHSRYAKIIPIATNLTLMEAALEFLTGAQSDYLTGSVLLAASDDALECIAKNRHQLSSKYLLDASNPEAQMAMLDKLQTYRIAAAAGVPTPRFWSVAKDTVLDSLREELIFPLIVKPLLSHEFQKKFPKNVKFITANDFPEVAKAVDLVQSMGIDVLLLEMIPGPDSRLCSYYTYMNEHGIPLFDFTKRIVRRYPKNMGLATYHVTDHVNEIKEPATRLFQQAKLIGLANAEFKFDVRDQTMKLIECNARFTAANGLVNEAGLDLATFVYNRIVGLTPPGMDGFQDNLTMWDPVRDYRAYRELRKANEMRFFEWVRSVCRSHTFPCFKLTDPLPAFARAYHRVAKSFQR